MLSSAQSINTVMESAVDETRWGSSFIKWPNSHAGRLSTFTFNKAPIKHTPTKFAERACVHFGPFTKKFNLILCYRFML